MADAVKWKAISLLHIEYPQGDLIGLVLAWASFLPITVVIGFVVLILFRRDIHTICFFLGLLLNTVFNLVIKHFIKEARPDSGHMQRHNTYGMPSDHAQFMTFFSTYVTLFLLVRTCRATSSVEDVWKGVLTTCVWCAAVVVGYSRVYLLYHTSRQVIAGSMVGMVTGVCWFGLIHGILSDFFPVIVSWPVSEFFMIRDYSLIPNALWFEYTVCRNETRARHRKQGGRRS